MKKLSNLWFAIVCLIGRASADSPDVEIIPESRMGSRGNLEIKSVQWNCETEWWGKKVEVCRGIAKAPDSDQLIAMAKANHMKSQKSWIAVANGKPGDGTTFFQGETSYRYAMVNPNTGYRSFGILPEKNYVNDRDFHPYLKGLPTPEKAVETCREWMKRLGIDETQLAKDPRRPGGFQIDIIPKGFSTWNKDLQKKVFHQTGMELVFAQRVGVFPAFWNGFGGCLSMTLADGGDFSNMRCCLRAWEPMGMYEILSRDELTDALKTGFFWCGTTTRDEKLRIDRIVIEAYVADNDVPQKHFPLIYQLVVRSENAARDSDYDVIRIPALKIHRNRYGPLPVDGS